MGGDVAVSTVVMPSGVAVGCGRPHQHSAGPGRSRSSIPQTPTRSWIHGLHQDRSVSCPFSERWLASFFYIMYIFINLSPRNGKSQGPDDQIEHELREVFACLTGSRSASADITSPAETRRQGGTINYEDRCPWLSRAVWPPAVTPRLILFMRLKTRQGTQLQYLVQLPSILKCAAVDPLISTISYHISVLIFGIINVLLHNCNWRTNTTPYKARGRVD